ncbi:MAG: hypothetical protein HFI40_14055 [Lachnospiraceae bacterium]|jgi:hypothetical protein|nr:hypothetical protein [Lachnospiraceae bacterium]
MNDVLILITTIASGKDLQKEKKAVFCERKFASRSEFYAAFAAGQKVRYEFIVPLMDYLEMKIRDEKSGRMMYPSAVEYEGEELVIIRAYEIAGDRISLTCG